MKNNPVIRDYSTSCSPFQFLHLILCKLLIEFLLSGFVFDSGMIPAQEIDLAHNAGGLF